MPNFDKMFVSVSIVCIKEYVLVLFIFPVGAAKLLPIQQSTLRAVLCECRVTSFINFFLFLE